MDIDDQLRRVSNGEIEALHEIYNEMRVPVFAVALAIVRNQYLAEDIQQETFLKLYEKANQYKTGTNPKAWILSITRNLAYDRLRQTIRQSHTEIEDSTKAEPDPALLRLELMDALEQLEETDRLIITMHVIAGFKHHEIGKELGLPSGTVRWRYRRSLSMLANNLGGEGHAAQPTAISVKK
jgi:RNA polymerase sigma-70 factor (ECF subfamily)